MVEDNSAVLQYIQQETEEEVKEQENDHALWILVSFSPTSKSPLGKFHDQNNSDLS